MRANREIIRSWGHPQPGTVYLEGAAEMFGPRTDHYVADSPSSQGLPKRATLYPREDGSMHLLYPLRVDEYPFASDFVEETRKFGFRVKCESDVDFSRLSNRSLIHFIHPRACLANAEGMRRYYLNPDLNNFCVQFARSGLTDSSHLEMDTVWCSRDWYALAAPTSLWMVKGSVFGQRQFTSNVLYRVIPPGPEHPEPRWIAGRIFHAPITAISVVVDASGRGFDTLSKVEKVARNLPVEPCRH